MARRGTLTVRVVSDTKPAEQGLDRFSKKVQSTGDKVENAGKKMTVFATVPIAAAMGVATKAASDLQQAVGGTEAVFGDAAGAIDDFAKEAASASGLSEREFREATTSIGGQLKRMTGDVDLAAEQSKALTQVAADLAATYGGTTAEAVEALGSAFRGEADPAERFNLNLKVSAVNAKAVELGLAASTTEVDDSARAQATLALITEQSADAQGQFARESDSAAGSMQIAKAEMENATAELGTALLPIVSKVAGGVADLATAFGDLPGPIQNGVLAIAGVLAAAGPVATVGGRLVTLWGKAGPAFDKAATGAYTLSGKLGGVAKGGLAVAAAFGAVQAVDQWAKATADNVPSIDRLTSSLLDFAESGEATNELLAITGDNFEDLGQKIKVAGNSPFSLFDSAGAREVQESNQQIDALDKTLAQLYTTDPTRAAEMFDQIAAAAEEQGVSIDTVNDRFNDYGDAVAGASNEARIAVTPTEDLGAATEELIDPAEEAAEAQKDLEDSIRGVNDALKAQFDPLFAAQDAFRRNEQAQRDVIGATDEVTAAQAHYNEVVDQFGRKSPEAQYALQQVAHAERLLAEANSETARTALEVTTATNELAAKMRAGEIDIGAAKDQLDLWAQQGLITEEQAAQVAGELDTVNARAADAEKHNIKIPVDLEGFERVIFQLDELARRAGTPLIYNASIVARDRALAGTRHSGGRVQADKMYLIGRPGHEELFSPDQSGEVISGPQTDRLLGRKGSTGAAAVAQVVNYNNNTINVNGGDQDAASIAEHLAWKLA